MTTFNAAGIRDLLARTVTRAPRALRQVVIAEGLSIAVMETAEVLVQVYTPGVMESGLHSGIFWFGMGLALVAGYAAAFLVNVILERIAVSQS